MSSRSLNKAQLIGNLTRDVELRYTPSGTPVATIGLATNRSWTDSTGQKQEETEFHRLVAWNKLAELCNQLLFKGRKVFVEGRLQTRKWTGQDGQERQTTEIVIEDMIVLDNRRREGQEDRRMGGMNSRSDNRSGNRSDNRSDNRSGNRSDNRSTGNMNGNMGANMAAGVSADDDMPVGDIKVDEPEVEEKEETKEVVKKEVKGKKAAKKESKKEEVSADDIPF
jgi:single-strand DNA-binding protein